MKMPIGSCKDCLSYDVCHIADIMGENFCCAAFKDKSTYVEIKDCTKCVHQPKDAGQYPCSRCRNLFQDKFEPKERENDEK